ncbi:MAG: 6-phosphogluconolactonase, partial [Candidatus Magasanikbacteria bacterium]|nr:6-phosphogluconolactonase [Candidatus Magasanikbacteria bacterium]
TFDTQEEFVSQSAEHMLRVVDGEEYRYLALAGGKTPVHVYEQFGKKIIDPSKIFLYQVDERYVPPHHPDANACMIYKHVGKKYEGEWAGMYFFDTTQPISVALLDYRHMLSRVPEGVFDLVVLGVGTDGHIASLFPYSSQLTDMEHTVMYTTTMHHFVHDRLTLGPKMIIQAKQILILLQGEEKRPVYEELQQPIKKSDAFPAHILQSHADVTVHYVL